jgi:hypothetical protein
MKMVQWIATTIAASALAWVVTETGAKAETAPTAGRVGVRAEVEYGSLIQETNRDNFYALGFGLEGGYTFNYGLYVGGRVERFLGDRGASDYGTRLSQGQGVVGYDVRCSRFMAVRPTIAVGMTLLESPVVDAGQGSSFGLLNLGPGIALINLFGPILVSVGVRYNGVIGRMYAADGLLVSLGAGGAF